MQASLHDKTYYEEDIDFEALAIRDQDFAAIFKKSDKRPLDFHDPNVVRQLTKSILKWHFDLTLDLPDDRLCPPVPVRWNFVRWIQQLLDTTSDNYRDSYDEDREVVGMDIGVGASAIYPLLACKSRPNWRMIGTDIDEHSITYAQKNITSNELDNQIKLVRTTSKAPLLPLDKYKVEELDFVMTNPPFYSSQEDMDASQEVKSRPPSAICTGSGNEMICSGGDVGFVMRIVEESLVLREGIQWYSAMLGKLLSLQQIVAKLKELGVSNFAVTALHAGHKTRRWAVAWSFADYRPRNDVARHGGLVQRVLPVTTLQTVFTTGRSPEVVGQRMNAAVGKLDVKWQWREDRLVGVMEAKGAVWSRAARRKKKFQQEREQDGSKMDEDDDSVALAVMMQCQKDQIEVRWLRGHDPDLFTGFCGSLKRWVLSEQ